MEFTELVSHFSLLKLHIVTRLTEPLQINGFAGDMLHNNFGMVLKDINPQLASAIYQSNGLINPDNQVQGQVKSFVIAPQQALQNHYNEGDSFAFELTLFNHCCGHLPEILNAIEVWQLRGFIPDKQYRSKKGACFNISTIDAVVPLMPAQRIYDFGQWSRLPQAYILADVLDSIFQNIGRAFASEPTTLAASIRLNSPVRLTVANNELRQVPKAEDWFNAITRRLWLLATAAGLVDDSPSKRERFYQSLPQQQSIKLNDHSTEFIDLQRYSARARKSQSLGGLLGRFSYSALDIRHLALLAVGQQLRVGGKTTFGFGDYQWQLMVQ